MRDLSINLGKNHQNGYPGALNEFRFDRQTLGSRSLQYDHHDQLLVELLLRVR